MQREMKAAGMGGKLFNTEDMMSQYGGGMGGYGMEDDEDSDGMGGGFGGFGDELASGLGDMLQGGGLPGADMGGGEL